MSATAALRAEHADPLAAARLSLAGAAPAPGPAASEAARFSFL